ncbi:MAG: metallopeptidase TldD-related protein [Gammaproteobacteria bacterium]|jgi:predicted Zn-dependent protease|nr:metallopeptidase TldD-related protein [Gammaproteobacteria bacterium]HJO10547.1 metallopeptidase TldD-related protein [Gammaproteobacteria bacterium]
MAEAKGLPSDELRVISDRVLQFSSADQCRVTINSGWRGYTRVATNRITSAGGADSTSINITSVFGKRVASVNTNSLEDDDLRAAVRRSETMARLAPESPEYMPELGPQSFQNSPANTAYYDSTGELEPLTRAEAAAIAIREAEAAGQIAASYMDVRAGTSSVATSNGLFGSHSSTGVAYTLTSRTPDGLQSGWAGDEASDWNNIESQRIADDAVRKCREWHKTDLEPGQYTAILEPTAVGMLMGRMMNVFNQRTADEGRSYFSKTGGGNRLGEKLFDDRVTIYSDPNYADAETAPFTNGGQPVSRQTWVNSGTVENLSRSRFWADQLGQEALPSPSNLIMQGGSDSLEEMIASTERGVLLTRFWYIRGLNPRIISYTGLTRDGTFLIEDGRISRPVTNFRFNQSLVEMLQNVQMIGLSVRVAASENSSVSTPIVVPTLKVDGFNLSSVSDAI